MEHKNWSCPKCQHKSFETGTFAATSGGMLSKMFDVQNKKFMTISCAQCKYTEVYKTKTGKLENVMDFFVGG